MTIALKLPDELVELARSGAATEHRSIPKQSEAEKGEQSFRFSDAERQELAATLAHLLEGESTIQFAYLHGSFLDTIPCHDIDIGVYLEGLPPLDMELFAMELGSRLGRQVHCPVDVRVLNNAPVPFAFQVLRGRLLQQNNPDLLARFFERTVSRYLDLKPLLLKATKEAFADA